MDIFRNLQARDWMIAAVAFVAGAFIFCSDARSAGSRRMTAREG